MAPPRKHKIKKFLSKKKPIKKTASAKTIKKKVIVTVKPEIENIQKPEDIKELETTNLQDVSKESAQETEQKLEITALQSESEAVKEVESVENVNLEKNSESVNQPEDTKAVQPLETGNKVEEIEEPSFNLPQENVSGVVKSVEENPSVQTTSVSSNSENNSPQINSNMADMNNENKKSINKKTILIFITVLILLIAVSFGLFMYRQNFLEGNSKTEANLSTVPTQQEISPTPTIEEVDLGKYSVKVLNGSGIKGAAADLKSILEEKGFDVLETGNATNSAFTDTVIMTKEDINNTYLEKLKNVLEESYTVSTQTAQLSSSQEQDITIIIGSQTAE